MTTLCGLFLPSICVLMRLPHSFPTSVVRAEHVLCPRCSLLCVLFQHGRRPRSCAETRLTKWANKAHTWRYCPWMASIACVLATANHYSKGGKTLDRRRTQSTSNRVVVGVDNSLEGVRLRHLLCITGGGRHFLVFVWSSGRSDAALQIYLLQKLAGAASNQSKREQLRE